MLTKKTTILAFIGLLAILLFSSLYTIEEGEHGLLLRLGKLVNNSETNQPYVFGPGLHMRLPIINQVRIFNTRMQTLDIKSSRIVTEEKKDVLVDYYVKWRISDLALYYTRTGGNEIQAETLLEQKLNDGLRAQFGKRKISEVVSGERSDIMHILKKQASESAKSLGIEVIDVRIKKIDLPVEVSSAVYERMRAERQRIANQHRADGRSAAEFIRAAADAKVRITVATAESSAKAIMGQGDAEAAKIYAEAYGKNPDFFAFYRSLSAYKDVFSNKQDILVLKPDSDFFKYFNSATRNNKVVSNSSNNTKHN